MGALPQGWWGEIQSPCWVWCWLLSHSFGLAGADFTCTEVSRQGLSTPLSPLSPLWVPAPLWHVQEGGDTTEQLCALVTPAWQGSAAESKICLLSLILIPALFYSSSTVTLHLHFITELHGEDKTPLANKEMRDK